MSPGLEVRNISPLITFASVEACFAMSTIVSGAELFSKSYHTEGNHADLATLLKNFPLIFTHFIGPFWYIITYYIL